MPKEKHEHGSDSDGPRAFLDQLLRETGKAHGFRAVYHRVSDPAHWTEPRQLVDILDIPKGAVPEPALSALRVHEDPAAGAMDRVAWNDFKWRLEAFVSVQDAFDAPLYEGGSLEDCLRLWYFYYESKYLLIESLLSGLCGFYAASRALLRVFLEFNILQFYYYRVVNDEQSYERLRRYFSNPTNPSWTTALKKAIPADGFCRPIRARLALHLKGLSRSGAHPYHPDLSPGRHCGQFPMPSLEGIFFWHSIAIVLQGVLWSYYVNFPMVFHPRDVLRKFGFKAPIGLFVGPSCSAAVRRSLSPAEYRHFEQYASSCETVTGLLDWYESLPDLPDLDIRRTWDTHAHGELGDITAAHCMQMAQMRAIRETFARGAPLKTQEGPVGAEESAGVLDYDKWKHAYKRFTKGA